MDESFIFFGSWMFTINFLFCWQVWICSVLAILANTVLLVAQRKISSDKKHPIRSKSIRIALPCVGQSIVLGPLLAFLMPVLLGTAAPLSVWAEAIPQIIACCLAVASAISLITYMPFIDRLLKMSAAQFFLISSIVFRSTTESSLKAALEQQHIAKPAADLFPNWWTWAVYFLVAVALQYGMFASLRFVQMRLKKEANANAIGAPSLMGSNIGAWCGLVTFFAYACYPQFALYLCSKQ